MYNINKNKTTSRVPLWLQPKITLSPVPVGYSKNKIKNQIQIKMKNQIQMKNQNKINSKIQNQIKINNHNHRKKSFALKPQFGTIARPMAWITGTSTRGGGGN
jgi:hypothetical protein